MVWGFVEEPPPSLPLEGGGTDRVCCDAGEPLFGSSPYQGEGGWGCESLESVASIPPPLAPPREGEGVD